MASAGSVRAGKAYVELNVQDNIRKGLDKVAKRVQSFGATVTKAGLGLTAIGTAITGPLALAGKVFADMGSNIFDASKRTGVAADQLSSLGFAADQSGASMEALETALKKMSRTIADAREGSKEAADALSDLGISVADLQGLSPDEQFRKIGAALNGMTDATKKSALAQEIFGRAGTALLPMLDGLAAAEKRAADLGLIISPEQAALADEFGDSLSEVFAQLKLVTFQAGAAVANALQPYADAVTRILKTIIDWVKENGRLIVTIGAVGAGVIAAGAALVTLGVAATGVGFALSAVSVGIGAVGAAVGFLLSPIGLVIAGLGALAAWFVTSTQTGAQALAWLGSKFNELYGVARDVFGGIADALATGDIQLAGQILFVGLNVIFTSGLNTIKKLWADVWTGMLHIGITVADAIQKTFFGMISVVTSAINSLQQTLANVSGNALQFLGSAAKFHNFGGTGEALQGAGAGIKIGSKAASGLLNTVGSGAAAGSRAISDSLKAIDGFAQSSAAASLSEADAKLEALRAQLAALRSQAEQERKAIELGGGPGKPELPDLADALEGVTKKIESRGTFNASALRSLQSNPVQDRIAKASERTARNTDRLVTDGGLA